MQTVSAIAAAACPAAGRYAGHRATVRWRGGGIAMRRIGVIVALGALLSMLGGAVTALPALAGTGTRPLHLAVTSLDFTSVECVDPPGVDPSDPSCKMIQSTIVAGASSNLSTGKGTFQATITVDLTPGGTCNIVDEPGAFI